MDAFPPIRQETIFYQQCDPDFCVNGYCTEVSPYDGTYFKKFYKNGTFCKCNQGYSNEDHCSLSK